MDNIHAKNVTHYFEIRQSIAVLAFKIIVVELIMSLIHYSLQSGLFYFALQDVLLLGLRMETLELMSFHTLNTIWLLGVVLNWVSTVYIMNGREIVLSEGVFNKQRQSYSIRGIQEIRTHQGLLGRLFKYGSIEIESPLIEAPILMKIISKPEFHAGIIRRQHDEMLQNNPGETITPLKRSL